MWNPMQCTTKKNKKKDFLDTLQNKKAIMLFSSWNDYGFSPLEQISIKISWSYSNLLLIWLAMHSNNKKKEKWTIIVFRSHVSTYKNAGLNVTMIYITIGLVHVYIAVSNLFSSWESNILKNNEETTFMPLLFFCNMFSHNQVNCCLS